MLGPHCNHTANSDIVFMIAFFLINGFIVVLFIKSYAVIPSGWRIAVVVAVVIEAIAYLAIGLSNPGIKPKVRENVN